MNNPIWYFLVEVRALPGDHQTLVAGSTAELECYVPAVTVDAALAVLDEFLREESFNRLRVEIVRAVDKNSIAKDSNRDFISKCIDDVTSTGRPCRGILFVARETAQWKE